MGVFAREVRVQGVSCAELGCGRYSALLAPSIGSMVLRLRDEVNGMDFFRYDEGVKLKDIAKCPVLYGFSTLYLPNRLGGGVLKTSDAVYRFPINEKPLNNFIHGFLHERKHTLVSLSAKENTAEAVTEYVYDWKDPMFRHFPLKFRLEVKYILSEKGLEHFYTLHNLSDKRLPVGIGSHTAIKAPFADKGNPEDIRMTIPVSEEIFLNPQQLCTGEQAVTQRCEIYNGGTMNPAFGDVNNQMFSVKTQEDRLPCVVIEDVKSGKKIFYRTGREYGFWLVWNCGGGQGYFCPEPMTWMINAPNLELPVSGYREIAPGESFTAYQRFSSEE